MEGRVKKVKQNDFIQTLFEDRLTSVTHTGCIPVLTIFCFDNDWRLYVCCSDDMSETYLRVSYGKDGDAIKVTTQNTHASVHAFFENRTSDSEETLWKMIWQTIGYAMSMCHENADICNNVTLT